MIHSAEKWYNIAKERCKLSTRKFNFLTGCLLALAVTCTGGAFAEQMPNPRAGTSATTSTRDSTRSVARTVSTDSGDTSSVTRSATRRATTTASRAATSNVTSRTATRNTTSVATPRSATVARTGVMGAMRAAYTPTTSGRNGASAGANTSRAAVARATAVFDDISKIGGGYATCREAYATCMDQFCAKANDTYRRCFCSSRFTEFRDTEAALDQAKTLLIQFENNDLNAVDKTAAEVNAMYTATAGEMAIKNDTSGAAAMLSEIGDLLSGKKKATNQTTISANGLIDIDFSTSLDDVWGDNSSSVFASNNTGTDLSTLEGQSLYTSAQNQCLALITESCENDAVLTMAKSSYNILITQDCNAYKKKIDSQRETVKQTVRTAEKYLREARLEEYRSHNSADVNECLAKVKTAVTADTACGTNYQRCLDYTGAYVNQNTGDVIPSPRLFQLEDLITLSGGVDGADVLSQNPKFDEFLETKRMFATSALDSCRDIAATVWQEFKRSALIEIAQAQSAKIEEVRMSCVNTMSQCYDTQTNALKNFDKTTAQASGAVSAYAARSMCQDRVIACASLYGNTSQCKFDDNGRLVSGNSTATDGASRCGLSALLAFVDTVDTVRVAEGCASSIDNYVQKLCTPTSGDQGFPWNCRKLSKERLTENIKKFAVANCGNPNSTSTNSDDTDANYDALPQQTQTQVEKAISDVRDQVSDQLSGVCEGLNGYWIYTGDTTGRGDGKDLAAFYSSVFGASGADSNNGTLGRCVENSTMVRCQAYNTDGVQYATYDRAQDECTFTDDWYKLKCQELGGYYDGGVCYTKK